jgi:hypothetical protein
MSINFASLFKVLDAMERSRRVDVSILPKIEELLENCKEKERYWLKEGEVPVQTAFAMYNASRNIRMVLDKVKRRFELATEKHENPKVISDSRNVLYSIYDIYLKLDEAKESKRNVNFILASQIMQSVRSLRAIAKQVKMLPTIAEEIAEISNELVKREFTNFDAKVWATTLVGL